MSEAKKIKYVTGRFVYIKLPPAPKKKVIVDKMTEEALREEMLKSLRVTTIVNKGELANPKLNIGDKVLVNPASLVSPSAVRLVLEESEGVDIDVILIQDYDIIHVWDM